MTYSLDEIERHWTINHATVAKEFGDWLTVFRELISVAGKVISSLESKKSLAENCTHILLSKGFNHSLATYTLALQGLTIDSSLTARNAIETFLMMELFATDPTEKYFSEWANGKEFKPAWVRNQLGSSLKAVVREVEIKFDGDFYETVQLTYSFWSGITHANLKSAEYSLSKKADGSYLVPTAGSLQGQDSLLNVLFAVVCSGLLRCSLIASAVYSLSLLRELSESFENIQRKINVAVKSHA